jgi:hypothetical protein
MKVGITLCIDKDTDIFSNGIVQNILYQRDLIAQCSGVEECYLINTHSQDEKECTDPYIKKYMDRIIRPNHVSSVCDVVIVCQGFIGKDVSDAWRRAGIKIVKHVMSVTTALFTECIITKNNRGVYHPMDMDAVWLCPHSWIKDQPLEQALHNCPAYLAPYVWEPMVIEQSSIDHRFPGYTPRQSKSKKIACVEPNINIVKTAIVPLAISELWHRVQPELIERFYAFGAFHIRENPDIINFVTPLSINQAKKCFFEKRYPLAYILGNHTDILLSHQNGCELNYIYLEAAWMGVPLVHNSPMVTELGWYYPSNDHNEAIRHLTYIAENFDKEHHPNDEYKNKSRQYIERFRIASNIDAYSELLRKLNP